MKIPVSNNTAMPLYVGSAMVPPGETRHFDEQHVPHHLRPKPAEDAPQTQAPADNIAELLQGTVKDVVAALPNLSIEDIERLGDLEQAGQARKGILSAVAESLLAKASNDQAGLLAMLSDKELLDNTSIDELTVALEAEQAKGEEADAELVAAIESAIAAKQSQE